MQIKHDGDGKIYSGGTFLFEVNIRDGDVVAKRINLLLESKFSSDNTGSPKFPLGCCECSERNSGSYGCGREYGDKPCRKYAVRSW